MALKSDHQIFLYVLEYVDSLGKLGVLSELSEQDARDRIIATLSEEDRELLLDDQLKVHIRPF